MIGRAETMLWMETTDPLGTGWLTGLVATFTISYLTGWCRSPPGGNFRWFWSLLQAVWHPAWRMTARDYPQWSLLQNWSVCTDVKYLSIVIWNSCCWYRNDHIWYTYDTLLYRGSLKAFCMWFRLTIMRAINNEGTCLCCGAHTEPQSAGV